MKATKEHLKAVRQQIIDRVIEILIKNNKEIDLTDRVYTPCIHTKVDYWCTLDRILYYGRDVTLDFSNEEYNCILTLEEIEMDYLIDIAIYLEENFG